ncbi:hypothetical protein QUC31_002109 [Theobroma cacao]
MPLHSFFTNQYHNLVQGQANMNLIGPIIEVIKFIGQPAIKYLKYHGKVKEYVDDFKQAQADLHDRKADTQKKLEEELHLGKMPKLEVKSWFKKVEKKISQAQASSRAEEIKTLKKLEVFEGCFTNVHDLSMSITFDRGYSRLVAICGCNMNAEDPIILPSDIRQLQLYHCKGRGSTLNDVFRTDLKECTIESCHEWESIFTSWCASLQTLEVLQLSGLWNLKVIFGESIPQTPVTFSSLKVIYLTSCGKLKNLLPAKWVLQNLQNLEEIEVRNCERMEEIIASEKEGMSTKNNVMFTLPKLRKLKLYNLPELKSICKTNEVMACDSLQGIEIMYCPKLKRIPIHPPLLELDNSQPSTPPDLKEICIHPEECWESMEWDHPDAKNVLLPLLKFRNASKTGWVKAIR